MLADKLIEESKRKLEDYWVRYNKLQRDYENAQKTIYALRNRLDSEIKTLKEQIERMSEESKINEKVQFGFFIVIYIAIVVYVFSILMHFFF